MNYSSFTARLNSRRIYDLLSKYKFGPGISAKLHTSGELITMPIKMAAMKLLILILFFIPKLLLSQGWVRTYGGDDGDYGYFVQQTTDGGYIIVGETFSFGNGELNIYLIKTDNNGDTLWTKTFGEYWDYGYSVQQTTDGGYIITGGTWSPEIGSSISLIKTNCIGDKLWTKTLGGEYVDVGTSVQQTTDGGFIVSGCTMLSENSYYDVCLIKTNSIGDSLWTKTFGGDYLDVGYSVEQTTYGGYIVTGYTELSENRNRDVYLIKTHVNGDSLWTRNIGGDNEEEGYSVQQTMDGGYIITGYTFSYGNGKEDVFLIKTDRNGNTLWTKTFGGENSDIGKSVKQTTDEGYIITGNTESFGNGMKDVYLIKTNSEGDTIWTKTFGDEYSDLGESVFQTSDGGYILTGYTWSYENSYRDVLLIKTDENGIVTSTSEIPISNPNRKLVKTIDLLGRKIRNSKIDHLYIEIYDDGSIEKKMILK